MRFFDPVFSFEFMQTRSITFIITERQKNAYLRIFIYTDFHMFDMTWPKINKLMKLLSNLPSVIINVIVLVKCNSKLKTASKNFMSSSS